MAIFGHLERGNGADRLLENPYFAQARVNSGACAMNFVCRTTLHEEGVLLFALPYREPKEDGGRNATDYR